MENDPPRILIFRHGRRSCAATCQINREGGAIIDICTTWYGLCSHCPYFTACPRVVTLTALQTAGAFVYTQDYRAVRTAQAAQPLYFVAASWLVVGTGELYAVVEWIPPAM